MKKSSLPLFVSLFLIVIFMLNGCKDDTVSDMNPVPVKYIKLGVILPLDIENGELRKNALYTAIDEINANSGIGDGYKLLLNIKSSEGPDRKVAAANAALEILKEDTDVMGFITSFSSSSTGVVEEVTIPKSYPTISGSATAVGLSGISTYFQRLCAPDPFEANVLSSQANAYGIASVAIAVEEGDPYSSGLA